MTDIMDIPDRDNRYIDYPVKEPLFPHYSNMGRDATLDYEQERDSIDEKDLTSAQNYDQKQDARKRNISRINLDWGRWKYMEVRYATQVDQDSRTCEWCLEEHPNSEVESFRKGNIVVREQFSNQDFKTLHMICAVDKIESLKTSLQLGQDKLLEIIRVVSR